MKPLRMLSISEDTADGHEPLEFCAIDIGEYRSHQWLDVAPEVQKLVDLLSDFKPATASWSVRMEERGADAVDARLRQWAATAGPHGSILYWVGHGWSDGDTVALAHAYSPAAVRASGISPAQLAEPIRARQVGVADGWALVIVDTCWSSRFVDKLNAELADGPLAADGVLLVGVSGDGATSLGRFAAAFEACLHENFRTNRRIPLWLLASELERRLPDGRIAPRRIKDASLFRDVLPIAANLTVPLDVLKDLEKCLARLTEGERRHFMAKAQGADEGELSWFFEGRGAERRKIVDWLRTSKSGMLVVTGPPGAGKSALLGHVLVHSRPDVQRALVAGGLLDAIDEEETPPAEVFDDVVHLTGISVNELVDRIADLVGEGRIPRPRGPESGVADTMDWLALRLSERPEPLTVLLDALDEARDPLTLARTVLRRLAATPGVRIVVGTRASTEESIGWRPDGDPNILQALGVALESDLVQVPFDSSAVKRYVSRRLVAARNDGLLFTGDEKASDEAIARAAAAVSAREREFLFARLAVHEILADPTLLAAARSASLIRLLEKGDHHDLFAAASNRLGRRSDSFVPLLEALALSKGRGLPICDGIWALAASAVGASSLISRQVTDLDISALLREAQPYISVDVDAGQTVYRLAHRTYVEHFLESGSS